MRKAQRNSLLKALSFLIIFSSLNQASDFLGAQPATALAPIERAGKSAYSPSQQDDIETTIYLPTVNQPPRVELNDVWTAEGTGALMEAFLPGKVIRFYGRGYVNIEGGVQVNLRWSMIGPCGSKTLANETVRLSQGSWMLYRTDVAPDCPGIYVYTLRMAYDDKVSFLTVPYVVNNPSEISTTSRQGFDKCNIPYGTTTESVNQMQTWWNLSSYYTTNLYIGGVSRYCSNTELDAVWVNLVAKQGWSFIPTWVGPQAPCTSFRYKFSSDLNAAYQQGITEANAAVAAARNLGFLGNAVIYYDMEVYSTTNLECREAVKSFLTGWTQRIKEHGLRSGVYGHRINANDWAVIYPTPDSAWIAYWVYPFAYNPYASAYSIPGVSDSLWYGHRIRQYTGGHVETYGGIAFNIDSNVAHGDVTVLANTILGVSGDITVAGTQREQTEQIEAISSTRSHVFDIQVISERTGWALVDHRLFWTEDAGNSWIEISPAMAHPDAIMSAQFLDEVSGWAVTQDPLTGQLDIYHTHDRGKNWSASSIEKGNQDLGPLASAVYLEFLDEQNGWVVVKQISSSNFSVGSLYRTNDGGKTWEELAVPMGEPVRFLDQNRGWIAGGPAGDELYRSEDGGRTWQQEQIYGRISLPADHAFVQLPIFIDDQNGVLPVKVVSANNAQIEIFTTRDAGANWESSSAARLGNLEVAGEGVIFSELGASKFLLASADNPQAIILDSASLTIAASDTITLPESVVKIDLTDHGWGWAITQAGDCSAAKIGSADAILSTYNSFQCEKRSQILRTMDFGNTWIEITPTLP